jgi:hypothetical protein
MVRRRSMALTPAEARQIRRQRQLSRKLQRLVRRITFEIYRPRVLGGG